MKLQLTSDLHLDFIPDWKKRIDSILIPVADTLIIAGDIAPAKHPSWKEFLEWAGSQWKEVYFILGNHEFYGSKYDEVIKLADTYYISPRYLGDTKISIESVLYHEPLKEESTNPGVWQTIFYGENLGAVASTLWFPTDPLNSIYACRINDFYQIKSTKNLHTITNKVYEQTKEEVLKTKEGGFLVNKFLLLTHHIPSELCIAPQYKGSNLNRFFVGDLTEEILSSRIPLVLFGHTHSSVDLTVKNSLVGETRFVCNPYGYNGENPKYKRDLVVEV